MKHTDRMEKFHEIRAHQLEMGGREKLEALNKQGRLNARERIEYFFDAGSFREIGLFTHSARPEAAAKTPADGKIIGRGKVNGRLTACAANDITVMGASSSNTNMKKIEYMRSLSCEKGLPLVFLGESSGARIPDTLGAVGMAVGGQNPVQYRRLRESPWISILLGHSYGSSAFYSAMSDIVVMQKNASVGIISSKMTRIATGEDTPPTKLAGWEMHAIKTGFVDIVADTEQECMDIGKKLLDFLPGHAGEIPPRKQTTDGSGAGMSSILNLLPEERRRAYDMKKIIETIMDRETLLELKPGFAKPCITCLARLDGWAVGVIANNPMHNAGALNADCCEKITSFIVLCDSYNIPLIMLVDTPGFIGGLAAENQKIVGKVINWMNALSLTTVPRMTIVVRKDYGQAYLNMGGGRYSDVFAAWPTAEISFTGPEPAVSVVHGIQEKDDPERFRALSADMTRDAEPWGSAGVFGLNDVIDPAATRDYLIDALEMLYTRKGFGVGKRFLKNWPTSY